MVHYKTYRKWHAMRQRCDNKNTKRFHRYGGRGITYDPAWKKYSEFFKDMGECPEGYTLERIDNDGNYNKSNCRWATPFEQNLNTSRTVIVNFNGVSKPLSCWAKDLGFKDQTLRSRLERGWSVERAFNTKTGKYDPNKCPHCGKRL